MTLIDWTMTYYDYDYDYDSDSDHETMTVLSRLNRRSMQSGHSLRDIFKRSLTSSIIFRARAEINFPQSES